MTKLNPKKLALEKAQGTVIKCLKSLQADMRWKNVNAVFRQQFPLEPAVIHGATWLMYRYHQKEKVYRSLISKFVN